MAVSLRSVCVINGYHRNLCLLQPVLEPLCVTAVLLCMLWKKIPQKSSPTTPNDGRICIYIYPMAVPLCLLWPSPTASNQHWKHFYNKWQFLYASYDLVLIRIICLMAAPLCVSWTMTIHTLITLSEGSTCLVTVPMRMSWAGWYQSYKCHLVQHMKCTSTKPLADWWTVAITNLDQCWRHFVPQSWCFWAVVVLFLHWWNLQTAGAQGVTV